MAVTDNFSNAGYSIDLPFSFSNRGAIISVPSNGSAAWRNKVLTLLSTGIDERIWYHNYGAGLNQLLFESPSVVSEEAKLAIEQMFAAWLPELKFMECFATYDSPSSSVSFSVIYQIPSGETDSVKINTASLTAAGEIKETYYGG
jgi:phage baseplate assembly protein W